MWFSSIPLLLSSLSFLCWTTFKLFSHPFQSICLAVFSSIGLGLHQWTIFFNQHIFLFLFANFYLDYSIEAKFLQNKKFRNTWLFRKQVSIWFRKQVSIWFNECHHALVMVDFFFITVNQVFFFFFKRKISWK